MSRERCWALSILAILTFFPGCDRGVRTYEVHGKVHFPDGTPLPGGTVSFSSLESVPSHSAKGEIQPDGTFELTTFSPGDGAVAGKHQAMVMVTVREGREGFPAPPTLPSIHPRFASFDKSGLEFTVSDDESKNQFDIVVTKGR